MKYAIFLLLCTVLCLLAGCIMPRASAPVSTDELLDGSLLGIRDRQLPEIDVLAITGEMRDWVQEKTGGVNHSKLRLRRLVQGLIDDGLLNLKYDDNLTRTAIQTFRDKAGNCLSFSMLFVALAREADLDVTFQMVDIPPSFSATGDIVKLNNHINVLVRNIRSDTQFSQNHVVDFNAAEYNGNYDTQRVSDNYALALYHSNLGVEKLQSGDITQSFLHFRRGLQLDARNPGIWTNLGALYSWQGFPLQASMAYQQALSIEPAYRSALVNMARVLTELGRPEEAESYRQRARFHQRLNPYFHHQNAGRLYAKGEFDAALHELAAAIRLKDDEHQFYRLQGMTYEKMGNSGAARQSYEQAKRIVRRIDIAGQYQRKL